MKIKTGIITAVLFWTILSSLGFSGKASAAMITFEGQANTVHNTLITREGFDIGNPVGQEQHFHVFLPVNYGLPDNGTGALINDKDTEIFVRANSKSGFTYFNLFSVDAASALENFPAIGLTITGYRNNRITGTVTLEAFDYGYTTLNGSSLGEVDLLLFDGIGNEGGFIIDNLDVRPVDTEPDIKITIGNPDGSTIRPLLGVNAGPLHTPGMNGNKDLPQEYMDYGVKFVRTHDFYGPLDMAEIYPDRSKSPDDPASYNFTDSDRYFSEILTAGCEPYFRLGDSYNNVTPPQGSELENWVKASVNVIQHYRNGKWNGFNSAFTYVEIWNEPDYNQFWPSNFSMIYFFELFDKTAKALRTSFPDLKIGGPGFTQNVNTRDTSKEILKDFLSYIKDNGTPMDFISCHHYTNDPQEVVSAINSMKLILGEKGFSSLPIHNTEWNTDTNMKTAPEQADLRINAKGAAIDAAIWIAFQKCGISEAFFFRGNDTNIEMPTFYGLFKADGTPKKPAYAFKLFKYMSNFQTGLEVSVDSQKDGLWMLAGKKSDGKTAFFIANISTEPIKYAFSSDRRPSKILEVSDNHDGIYTHSLIGDVIEISENSVQYVEFENAVTFSSFILNASSSVQPGNPVTVNVNAAASSGAPLYYKFFYCGNYGTTDYSTTPWTVIQDYSPSNQATYNFQQAGNYILVARAVTDPQDEPSATPLTGATICIGGNEKIIWNSLTSDKTGTIKHNENITISANAISNDGSPVYYKFYYCGNYGTEDYASTTWTMVQDYSQNNQANYNFQQAGNYVIVVRAVTNPSQEPAALAMIGGTVTVQ